MFKTDCTESANNVPSKRNFVRRIYHAFALVDRFIYINGKEIQELPMVDGEATG